MKGDGGSIVRKRDVILIVVVAFAVYLSFGGGGDGLHYSLDPTWYQFDRAESTREWKGIPPLVTDLNGDGLKEIVVVTKDLRLQILDGSPPNEDYSNIYSPQVLFSSNLVKSSLAVSQSQKPVAIQTGYVDPYSETEERSQVIVVVREDWTVVCYDSSLKMLWEKAVAHKTHEMQLLADKYYIDDISITVLPLSIKKDAYGVIFVGASMRPFGGSDGTHVGDSHHASVLIEHGLDYGEDGNKVHKDMKSQASLEHFNIYALDAKDGHVIWRHDGFDSLKPEQFSASLPQHAFRLDSRDLHAKSHHAAGITNWNIFRESMVAELPHFWSERDDTLMRLAHFQRKHVGSDKFAAKKKHKQHRILGSSPKGSATSSQSSSQAKSKRGAADPEGAHLFTGVETPPLSRSATLPHDAAEHTEYPNVVVMHTKTGLDVVTLKTGMPVTSVALNTGNLFSDLNGDGVVDEVLVVGSKDEVSAISPEFVSGEGSLPHCSIMVLSGLPAHSQLFNGTICKSGSKGSLNDPASTLNGKKSHRKNAPAQLPKVVAAPPAVLRVVDPKTYTESKVRDVAVAINAGVITTYSGSGELKWQVDDSPTWHEDYKHATSVVFDADSLQVDETGSHDNLKAHLLVVGDKSMALYSKEGKTLATIDIPKEPIVKPVMGDFDSDGITDIIFITEDAILGYRLEVKTSTRGVLTAILILAAIAAVAFLANIKVAMEPRGSAQTKRSGISMGIKRATDAAHID